MYWHWIRYFAFKFSIQIYYHFSKSSKFNEAWLRNQFYLPGMKIKDEGSNILFCNRAFSDVLEGVILQWSASEKDCFGTYCTHQKKRPIGDLQHKTSVNSIIYNNGKSNFHNKLSTSVKFHSLQVKTVHTTVHKTRNSTLYSIEHEKITWDVSFGGHCIF